MSISNSKIGAYVTALDVKSARSVRQARGQVSTGIQFLASIHDGKALEIDKFIIQHNRYGPPGDDWQGHLISLSAQLEPHLSEEQQPFYRHRLCSPADLLGVKMFDDLRPTHGIIQSLAGFSSNFEDFGGSVLRNLDWKNVGVAGGSVLACLTEPTVANLLGNSDIE
ncbi:hypothetical protein CF326_g6417 [Tilletia indica]|nr:hypothetical protein CF326_g6417 [Tilletia indica]